MQQSYFPPGDYTSGRVTYLWKCARCGLTAYRSRDFNRGDAISTPSALPEEWIRVEDQLFCQNHKVRIFVDDKLIGTEGA